MYPYYNINTAAFTDINMGIHQKNCVNALYFKPKWPVINRFRTGCTNKRFRGTVTPKTARDLLKALINKAESVGNNLSKRCKTVSTNANDMHGAIVVPHRHLNGIHYRHCLRRRIPLWRETTQGNTESCSRCRGGQQKLFIFNATQQKQGRNRRRLL